MYEFPKLNRTTKLYYNAIVELASKLPANKISVQMICDHTETSKCTFYRYFRDKYDLFNYVYYIDIDNDGYFKNSLQEHIQNSISNLKKMEEKKAYYRSILALSGPDSFREFYINCTYQNYYNACKQILGYETLPKEIDFYIKTQNRGIVEETINWLLYDNYPLSIEEFSKSSWDFLFPDLKESFLHNTTNKTPL